MFGHGGDVSEWVCVNSTSVVRAEHGRRVLPEVAPRVYINTMILLLLELTALLRRPYNTRLIRCAHMASRPSVQQAVHDRDDEYGPPQARGGEINTHAWMFEQGAACARSAVDIWGSAWASDVCITSVGKGLTLSEVRSSTEAPPVWE